MKPVMVVVGTRPEIIKMAPVVKALLKSRVPLVFVHCGQHYDYNMTQQFIEELDLPVPDYAYKVKISSPGEQTARIIVLMDRLLKRIVPSLVLVKGDTNSVLATALAANKRGVLTGHVEAGFTKVVGTETRDILNAIADAIGNRRELPEKSPFGDGAAAERIVDTIKSDFSF
jgi:UDP-N-acetylglucosamine 2-epimerase (non-hydrolysing)